MANKNKPLELPVSSSSPPALAPPAAKPESPSWRQREAANKISLRVKLLIVVSIAAIGFGVYWLVREERPTYYAYGASRGNPTVIILHGYGAPGDDFRRVAKHLVTQHQNLRVVLPVGPYPAGKGYCWARNHDINEWGPARDTVIARIKSEVAGGTRPEQIIVAGFSQGGMMALDVAAHFEAPIAGVASFSGSPPRIIAFENIAAETPVFMAYGRAERALSYGQKLKSEIEQTSLDFRWHLHPSGHTVPLSIVETFSSFIDERLSTERE